MLPVHHGKTARLQDRKTVAAHTSVLQGSDAGVVPVNALGSCAPELPECKVTTRGNGGRAVY